MNLWKVYKSRKYLLKILLSVMLLMVVFLSISAAAQYYISAQTATSIQREAVNKVLNQISYNIDSMDEQVKNFAISTYFDPEIISLMNSNHYDTFDVYPKLGRLEKAANSTSFLQSIEIYNAHNGCYYSTAFSTSCNEKINNKPIFQYIKSHSHLPKLKLVPITLQQTEERKGRVDFFSYFMYDSIVQNSNDSILILNIKPDWLFGNLQRMNEFHNQNGSVFIMDVSGSVLRSGTDASETEIANRSAQLVKQQLATSHKKNDFIVTGSGSTKLFVSYVISNANDWVVVSTQPYTTVLGKLDNLRLISAFLVVVFLFLSLFMSYFVSHRLYDPIQKMLLQLKNQNSEFTEIQMAGDELSLITSEYQQAKISLRDLWRDQSDQKKIISTYYMKKLITESSMLAPYELAEIQKTYGKIDFQRNMLLVLLHISGLPQRDKMAAKSEMKLIKFAVANIAEEILSKHFANEIVDMRNDQLVLLLNIDEPADSMFAELITLLENVHKILFSYYGISVTAVISEPVDRLDNLSIHYANVLNYANYRLIYGNKTVITPETVQMNENNTELNQPTEMESKLLESIRSNNLQEVETQFALLMNDIACLNYENASYSLLHLLVSINNAVREMNHNGLNQISIPFNDFFVRIMRKDSLKEVHDTFLEMFRGISRQISHSSEGKRKNDLLIGTIKDFIEENYMDVDLSLQKIASLLKMSPSHISKLFRESEPYSITELITEIRLARSLELLLNTDTSINEIVEKVGFGNSSYFFRLFKKKFGTTPKEYRLKKSSTIFDYFT